MEQVSQYLDGERDYTLIKGGTGPLVYPAAHVYIYSGLHWLTNGGRNILLAQIIFGGLYLSTLALVMACYRAAKVRFQPIPILNGGPPIHSMLMLAVRLGPTVRLPSSDLVQAATQPVCPSVVQRLLCGWGTIPGHLRVPEKAMDDWQHSLLIRCRHQDEPLVSSSSGRHHTLPSIACPWPGNKCGFHHGTSTGNQMNNYLDNFTAYD